MLMGGKDEKEGNVITVGHGLQLGPVCDKDWGYYEATVVCKQMGYSSAEFLSTGSYFETVLSKYAMYSIDCTGEERNLLDCDWESYFVSDCGVQNGAGVICK
jgi:hypothetical protein